MLHDLIVGFTSGFAAGLACWAVLPRGVVLTRSMRTLDYDGKPLYDTWEVKNDSAVGARLTSVMYSSVETFKGNKPGWWELPPEAETVHGVDLYLEDDVEEMIRMDRGRRWKGTVVKPGDTMRAHVLNNHDLRIRYRRAGRLGFLERREVMVRGGT